MVARVTEAGGQVASPPQDAGPGGRAATFIDPSDVEFRVWQARRSLGAQVVNVPNSWNFSDLHTADATAARAFYGRVFGWEAEVHAVPGFADGVAWLAPVTDDEEPHWHVSFAVADRDADVATAVGLGAVDLRGPIDTMWTKSAVGRDPQGAIFTLTQFTPPDA